MKVEVTPEVIKALDMLRTIVPNLRPGTRNAFNILDNAGVFSAIDEATGYDVDPEPDASSQVSALAVNRDGSLRAHTNDMCEPCSQGR